MTKKEKKADSSNWVSSNITDCLCFKSGERNRKNRAWPEISDGGKLY